MTNCIRHKNRLAKRRCYQCRSPLCPECQLKIDHHLFCSDDCHGRWRRIEKRKRIMVRLRSARENIDPRIWWRYPPFLRNRWATRASILLTLLLLCQLATVLVLWHDRDRTTSIRPNRQTELRWLQRPAVQNNEVHFSVAGGSRGGWVLRNGIPFREIRPQMTLQASTPLSPQSDVWSLQSSRLKGSESWTVAVPGKSLYQASHPGIALTFDGGSKANLVDSILASLRRQQVTATFFLTGIFMQRFPQAVRRILSSGHEIGNHLWDHPHLTTFDDNLRHNTLPGLTKEHFQWQLLATENQFHMSTGSNLIPFFRPPYGELNDEIASWAAELGYTSILWTSRGGRKNSMDTLDWVYDSDDPLYVSGKEMAAKMQTLASQQSFRGGIILMHVGSERKTNRIQDHLDSLLMALKKKQIPIVPVSTLFGSY